MTADPRLLLAVPETSPVRVTATAPLVHRCPHVPETDAGTVTIVWDCAEATLELHALSGYLASWATAVISHEEVTAQIAADLDAVEGVEVRRVSTSWATAGIAVTVDHVP